MMIRNQLLRSLYHSFVYNAIYRGKLERRSTMVFEGLQLTVEPAVHHPGIFKSGKMFAETLLKCELRRKRVLDMGTGSGILALSAARLGADVVAIDKDPAAVRCTRENARRNGLEFKIRVLEGDLFSPVPDSTFDVILFNPPYLLNETGTFRDMALHGGDNLEIIHDFAAAAGARLTSDGYILMITSTDSDPGRFLQIFRDLEYDSSLFEKKQTLFETFSIYKFTPHKGRENF